MTGIRCGNCRELLPPNHIGPCPKCGATNRLYNQELVTEPVMSKASLSWGHRHEFVRKNPQVNVVVLLLTFGPAFLGLVLTGVSGLLIGLVLGVICYLLGPLAAERVIEITKGKSDG